MLSSSRKELDALCESWRRRWPEALELWSRFTKLGEPHWCFTAGDEEKESLASSFAMIRLDDHAVVLSLRQIHDASLDGFPLEIMGHEIGHHVYAPGDLGDQARLIARMRRGLPGKEQSAGMLANIYSDLLINDRLERQAGLKMSGVYAALASGSKDTMWTFYMRVYEHLWNLPKGSVASGEITRQLDFDAGLGARLIRVYARDWLKGAGRFAALCLPYLEENDGEGLRKALRGFLDTPAQNSGEIPDGLTEIDEDEEEGAIHPALDPEINGVDEESEEEADEKSRPKGATKIGDTVPRKRYREPFDYKDILRSAGVKVPDEELTIRYYRERAVPYLVRFPVKVLPESSEPLPEGVDSWDIGESLDQLDLMESLLVSDQLVPGVTTVQRTWGNSPGSTPDRQPLDLYLGVDCSGSMSNPSVQMSYPVLAGTIIAISALRAGARVMVVLSGEPGSYSATEGFITDEHEILMTLTGYLGTGYSFGIHRLTNTFSSRKPTDRPVHIMIVTDHDIFAMLGEKVGKRDGWTVAAEALAKARGGGRYVLHIYANWGEEEVKRMKADGWDVSYVLAWEDIVEFARQFSQKNYAQAESQTRN
jgi:hypothetical protein